MAIEFVPLPLPATADPSKFTTFGRQVKGVDPGKFTPEQFQEIRDALYKVCCFIFCTFRRLIVLSTTLCYSAMSTYHQSSSMR